MSYRPFWGFLYDLSVNLKTYQVSHYPKYESTTPIEIKQTLQYTLRRLKTLKQLLVTC